MNGQISSGSSSRSISRKARPALESLEIRRLMAIVVNTSLDETVANATTSLREAVAQADANPGDDTITFDPTVFDNAGLHTITLTQGEMEIAATNGKVTIQGPGSDVLAIDAGGLSRVFHFDTGTSGDISGLKLMNGKHGSGGAVYTDATLSLSNYRVYVEGVLTVNGTPTKANEGVLALSGTPTSGNHCIDGTITVAVSDGKLTLTNASGSVNNKIDYIEITPV